MSRAKGRLTAAEWTRYVELDEAADLDRLCTRGGEQEFEALKRRLRMPEPTTEFSVVIDELRADYSARREAQGWQPGDQTNPHDRDPHVP